MRRDGFRGCQVPRTATHFAFVRTVGLVEQTTRPSRTVDCLGASPSFISPNPLRWKLLFHSQMLGSLPGLPRTEGASGF